MNTPDYKELVNRALDGELDADGRAVLDAQLSQSAEAREFLADMQSVVELVEQTPSLEPPEGLRSRITAGIQLPAATAKPDGFSWSQIFSLRQAAGLTIAFGAGLLLATGFNEIMGKSGAITDPSQLVGTMVRTNATTPADRDAKIQINQDILNGNVFWRYSEDLVVVEFQLQSADPVEVVFEQTPPGYEFRGFARADTISAFRQDELQQVRIGTNGSSRFSLALGSSDWESASLSFEILANGEQIYRGTIDAAQ